MRDTVPKIGKNSHGTNYGYSIDTIMQLLRVLIGDIGGIQYPDVVLMKALGLTTIDHLLAARNFILGEIEGKEKYRYGSEKYLDEITALRETIEKQNQKDGPS